MLDANKIEAMRQQLKSGGVKVETTTAASFFPTPIHLAFRMVDALNIKKSDKILEPSAGSGNLLRPIDHGTITTVEISYQLAENLTRNFPYAKVLREDFLTLTPEILGRFDKILMNPPFERGQEIDHVNHAFKFLKPDAILCTVMSEGPFFRSDKKAQAFRTFLESVYARSEKLPPDTFKESGTLVNTRLVIIKKGNQFQGVEK